EYTPVSGIAHLRERLVQERMPVAHADVDRQRGPVRGERARERDGLRPRQLVEWRSATRHRLVVMRDGIEARGRDAATARDELEEGPDLVGTRRAAEGDEQHRVVRHGL